MSNRYVVIAAAAKAIGYSAEAIRTKIKRGIWRQGKEWRRAPDGRILVDMEGVTKWVESPKRAALK